MSRLLLTAGKVTVRARACETVRSAKSEKPIALIVLQSVSTLQRASDAAEVTDAGSGEEGEVLSPAGSSKSSGGSALLGLSFVAVAQMCENVRNVSELLL
jgi:hypothetical protein